jgi:hypothetical protein
MGTPGRRVAHVPHRPRPAMAAGGLFVLGAAACLAPAAVPRLAAPTVVEIRAGPPGPALSLGPTLAPRQGPRVIVIPPPPPLRPAIAPAIVLDGRLWCPRRSANGGSTPHPGLPELVPAAVLRTERLTGAEARRYASRCGAPTDGVVRIVTRAPTGG